MDYTVPDNINLTSRRDYTRVARPQGPKQMFNRRYSRSYCDSTFLRNSARVLDLSLGNLIVPLNLSFPQRYRRIVRNTLANFVK
jgi:hypothetical protein